MMSASVQSFALLTSDPLVLCSGASYESAESASPLYKVATQTERCSICDFDLFTMQGNEEHSFEFL
jgi:hypothetical protein